MASNTEVSITFLRYELASTIEQAVRSAVDTVLKETAKVVSIKIAAARTAAAESHRENQSLRERLEMSEGELKAIRYYMTAAEKNIKQCLLLNNQNHPRSGLVRPQTEDSLFLVSPNAVEGGQLTRPLSRSLKSFRNSSGRTAFSRTHASVGLCLPTPQTDWPRSATTRRRMRNTVSYNQSVPNHNQPIHAPSVTHQVLTEAEGDGGQQFFIADDGVTDKEYKGSMITMDDGSVNMGEQEAPAQHADTSDLSKFEFEVGGAAGNVNELGLIQVLEDQEEGKDGLIKIEDDQDPLNAASTAPSAGQDVTVGDVDMGAAPSTSSTMQTLPPLTGAPLGAGDANSPFQGAAQVSVEDSEKIYRCNVCGRGFRRFYCLKTHQRIHTGERPYPCRYCEKRFRHLDSLHKHQRIHTGERPYRCTQCSCCFRELGQLKKHRLTHSPAQGAGPPPAHSSLPLLPSASAFPWPHLGAQSLDSL